MRLIGTAEDAWSSAATRRLDGVPAPLEGLELPCPDGNLISIACTLLRCREAAPGWFEGAVCFNREQLEFGA